MIQVREIAKWIAAALGGGSLAKFVDVLAGRRKSKADEADVITKAAATAVGVQEDVIERLQQQTQALVLEADNLRREVAALRKENATLHTEIASLKQVLAELRAALPPARWEAPSP